MDPVSHLLFGRTVAQTVKRRTELRGLTAALVIGSILPDVDALLAFRGFEQYLRAHVAGTHSLVGALVGGVALAAVLRAIVRDSRFAVLLTAACAGVLGHIFWDLAGGGDINALEPFSTHTFNWQLVAMGDPLVAVLLLVSAILIWTWKSRARQIACAGLALLGFLLAVKLGSQIAAHREYDAAVAAESHPSAVDIAPRFGTLFDWTVYDRVDSRVRAWRVNSRTGRVALLFEHQDAADGRAVEQSRELPVVRAFFAFARIPFVRLEPAGTERVVLWSDVRMCSPAGCDLSFGGAFSAAAAPLYQVIQIGGFRENRPLPRDFGQ